MIKLTSEKKTNKEERGTIKTGPVEKRNTKKRTNKPTNKRTDKRTNKQTNEDTNKKCTWSLKKGRVN